MGLSGEEELICKFIYNLVVQSLLHTRYIVQPRFPFMDTCSFLLISLSHNILSSKLR